MMTVLRFRTKVALAPTAPSLPVAPAPLPPPPRTLQELFSQYLADGASSQEPSTQYQLRCFYDWWVRAVGDPHLADVTPAWLHVVKASLSQAYKSTTVHKYLARLDAALKFGVRCGWLSANPMAQVRKPSISGEGRVRYLSDDERQRLLAACRRSRNPLLYGVVLVALATGGRKNEVRRLRWEQVDLPGEQIRFIKTKTHRARAVPLVGEPLTILKTLAQQRRPGVPWVFPSWRGNGPVAIDSAWETARNHAQIEDFHFHDLRHTFASYMAMSGATLREIADVLGHGNIQMTLRYAHLLPSHTRGVVERMSTQFLQTGLGEDGHE